MYPNTSSLNNDDLYPTIGRRPLHIFFLCDKSGSMAERGKIQALNDAGREAVPAIRDAAAKNKRADVFARVLTFGGDAAWLVAAPTPIENFEWPDVGPAYGGTPLGEALTMLAEQLRMPPMDARGLPPVVVVVSDGQPTDDFESGYARLMAEPWAQKSVRVSIGIGDDADFGVLQRLCDGQDESALAHVLKAENPGQLADLIQWASTSAVLAASTPIATADVVAATPALSGPKVF